ncbi:GDYXXLXY domain-containing protein [Neobacillus sp. PS3-40]|uniref:GDYXXLXY domain-containing protein n=1 Tax=Neobacillus sp. PS3-40 TaxID=3070679 RepID=UPI0027DFE3E3|nr:GDYXXLXY domain-containing protein [Neobacillus sp. PS3-40]WML42837.1 GDYXXLXY domain-containing protein [Neobacillus sp. PS3-40]
MNKRTKYLLLACAVPVLILLGMCVTPLYTIMNGDDILLQTRPIDPSDPFSGDYVSLQYEAEQVPQEMVETKILKDNQYGTKVYVLLKKKNGVHTPIKVTLEKPKKGIYLKGVLNYIDDREKLVYLQYSLDKYYVEDNTGTKWENAALKGGVRAKVKVKNGYAMLVGIEKK